MARPGCVLAIDHGTKRTGFALADGLRVTIEPLDVYRGAGEGKGLLDHVAELLADRDADVLLVGQPLNMDGSAGPRAADVDAFCERLAARFPRLALVRRDERLTTKEAQARLVESGHTGAGRKSRLDSWSALVLLEDWIRAGEPR